MKLNFITQHKKTTEFLVNNIGYIGDALYGFNVTETAQPSTSTKFQFEKIEKAKAVMIVARKHYVEKWKTYPAVSHKELKSILALQKVSSTFNDINLIVENKQQDGFDVKTITFSNELTSMLPENIVLFPETELLTALSTDNNRIVAQVTTFTGELFWAYSSNKTNSVYQGGLLNNLNGFIQSIGLSIDSQKTTIAANDYANVLVSCLTNIQVNDLYRISSINLKKLIDINQLHQLYLAPLAVTLIFVLISNAYLYINQSIITNDIASSQSTTSNLLSTKKEIDEIEQQIATVSHEFEQIDATHVIWKLVAKVIDSGMEVSRFSRSQDVITLRGRAEQASAILSELNQTPGVKKATFQGSINKSRGQDLFTIEFEYHALSQNNATKEVVNTQVSEKIVQDTNNES